MEIKVDDAFGIVFQTKMNPQSVGSNAGGGEGYQSVIEAEPHRRGGLKK